MSLLLYGWPKGLELKEFSSKSKSRSSIKISIVIPTLNQSETLEHTLLSIINQDYSNFEVIVIDGGSSDNTFNVVDRYHHWIDYFTSGNDNGQSDAINKGFSLATGNILGWINSDDYYLPSAFSKVVKTFNSNPNTDIIVGAGDVISRDCKFLKHISPMLMEEENLTKWVEGKWLMQQSCFWTAEIWKKSGGVDESLSLLMDFDLWFRFAQLGKSITLNETLAAMRYYPEIKTVSLRELVNEETAYVFAKNAKSNEVRRIVRDLVEVNKLLIQEKERRQSHLLIRILKRLRIEI